ncbi:hypothetical protein [Tateyamaria sp. SN3-11]|uniref:hypothetical protein n=1 Tax=Tateyamaria sp. SN3-11 TaxID=3092147 RepID=UPI0039ECC332
MTPALRCSKYRVFSFLRDAHPKIAAPPNAILISAKLNIRTEWQSPIARSGRGKMADTIEEKNGETAARQSEVTITLSSEVLAGLRTRVAFRTVGDVQTLVADALNSYVLIGQLTESGAEIFARQQPDGDFVRLHFPFDPAPDA